MKKNSNIKGILILLFCAFIWGSCFVAQAEGMEKVEPFTFGAARMLIGSFVLIPVMAFSRVRAGKKPDFNPAEHKAKIKRSLIAGAGIGVVLTAASSTQQYSLVDSAPGKVAFITAFYMFLVPIFGLFLKKRPGPAVWLSLIPGIFGLYLLCIGPGGLGSVGKGDYLAFACAVLYAVHILCIERFGADADPVALSFMQFLVTGVLCFVLMLIFEKPDFSLVLSCAVPILYAGVLSSGVAFTLQTVGQRYAEPAVASLAMCTESVFGVLSSCVFYRTLPTLREGFGCAVMFLAIILSQTPDLIAFFKKKEI